MTTAAALLAEAVGRLAAAGVETPATDARRLLAHAAGAAPGAPGPRGADPVPAAQAEAFRALVAARAARRPLAHLTGWRAFWTHRFAVTPDVLDPRPETETLVAAALARPFARLLDLGTGSGCILLSLLSERPGATGLGTDVSEAALAVAARNAAALGLAGRAAFARSDWFAGVSGVFDLIVANPPYIAEAELAGLDPEVRDHEPRLALTPGADALAAYRAILAGAPAHLVPGGALMVEIGAAQGPAVAALFAAAGFAEVAVHPDLAGRDRVVSGRLPARARPGPAA